MDELIVSSPPIPEREWEKKEKEREREVEWIDGMDRNVEN